MEGCRLFKVILSVYEETYGRKIDYEDEDIIIYLKEKVPNHYFHNSTNVSVGDLLFKKSCLDFFNYLERTKK